MVGEVEAVNNNITKKQGKPLISPTPCLLGCGSIKVVLAFSVSVSLILARGAIAQDDSASEERSESGMVTSIEAFEDLVASGKYSALSSRNLLFDPEAPQLPQEALMMSREWNYPSILEYYKNAGGNCKALSDESLFCSRGMRFRSRNYEVSIGFSRGPEGILIVGYNAYGAPDL